MAPSRASRLATDNTIHMSNNKTIDTKAIAIRAATEETHNRIALGQSRNRPTVALTATRKQEPLGATVCRGQQISGCSCSLTHRDDHDERRRSWSRWWSWS